MQRLRPSLLGTSSGLAVDEQGEVQPTLQVRGPTGLRATPAAGPLLALASTSAPPPRCEWTLVRDDQ